MSKFTKGASFSPENNHDIVFLVVNFAHEACSLVHLAKPDSHIVADTELLIERYSNIYHGDSGDLVQLLKAALEKFSQLSPALGINVSDSVICNKLRDFDDRFANEYALASNSIPA